MAKPFQDKQKKSTSTAEIEYVFGQGTMQFQILHAFAIDPQPAIDVGVFSVLRARPDVALLDLA